MSFHFFPLSGLQYKTTRDALRYNSCIYNQLRPNPTPILVKMQILEIIYFWKFDIKFGFKSIELAIGTLFLINNVKNRGKFLFTFPHPSPNGTSVLVDSPWAIPSELKSVYASHDKLLELGTSTLMEICSSLDLCSITGMWHTQPMLSLLDHVCMHAVFSLSCYVFFTHIRCMMHTW
jgi:hypothetical protein